MKTNFFFLLVLFGILFVSYKITRTAEGFQGESTYDWDNDGAFDDLLLMKTKRITSQK